MSQKAKVQMAIAAVLFCAVIMTACGAKYDNLINANLGKTEEVVPNETPNAFEKVQDLTAEPTDNVSEPLASKSVGKTAPEAVASAFDVTIEQINKEYKTKDGIVAYMDSFPKITVAAKSEKFEEAAKVVDEVVKVVYDTAVSDSQNTANSFIDDIKEYGIDDSMQYHPNFSNETTTVERNDSKVLTFKKVYENYFSGAAHL